jgi:trimeric autotransporter adhesin
MERAQVKTEFRWMLRKKGKHAINICRQVILYTGLTYMLAASVTNLAFANPEGGVVTGGSATIVNTPEELQIHQSSDRALIEWASFNIDKGETTRFYQPNSNSLLPMGGSSSSIRTAF